MMNHQQFVKWAKAKKAAGSSEAYMRGVIAAGAQLYYWTAETYEERYAKLELDIYRPTVTIGYPGGETFTTHDLKHLRRVLNDLDRDGNLPLTTIHDNN